ncbi:conserved Plasmodium protein, unknown function [Plasmodium vivax]|uniref:Uncharacterized protein n=1 Tax=Plasmodium vivax TaxID=5855 RepID=A0A565A0F5_PLAVI|nr:conserved Plasmodium protein, unknown function [Plasmodium vivax]
MNESKKLDIIRSMLHTLLGDPEKERKDDDDVGEEEEEGEGAPDGNNNPHHFAPRGDHRNVCNATEKEKKEKKNLKKKYVEKSKKVISFYRKYMNKSEQKELEKYANLYDIVLNNSFEQTERDSIDTYMYCNVFPMLKKTFDAFVIYVAKLNEHKNDESYKQVIKNFDPIALFSQYIIRLTDEDFSQSDKDDTLFEEELSGGFSAGGSFQKKGTLQLDKLIHDECFVTTGEVSTDGKKKDAEMTQVEKEINDFYSNYDLVAEENKLKRTQKRREILKSIYSKKNVLSAEEIALYNAYYEERIKVRGKKVLAGRRDSSLSLNFAATNSFGNVDAAPSAFNITLELEGPRGGGSGDISGGRSGDANEGRSGNAKPQKRPKEDPPGDDLPNVEDENLDELIKQLERRESSYFEKRVHFVLDKWVREEEGRRLIINQKDKIKPIFEEFKKKNYTITDKDIIPLLFFIDKKLFLNYTLVHQYNFNNFHYVFYLHSSFYCSDTNSITFEEVWSFLVSNLPLNFHLYKEDILLGLEKFYRKKKMIRNFQFTITFVRNFLLFLLMDMFLFLSPFAKRELRRQQVGPVGGSVLLGGSGLLGGLSLARNFYLHMDSLSPFYSSSEGPSSGAFSSTGESSPVEALRSACAPPSMHRHSTTQAVHSGDDPPEKDASQKTLTPFAHNEDGQMGPKHRECKPPTLHPEGCVKRNLLLHLLMLLWGINVKMDGLHEEVLISDELSTDMEGEAGEAIGAVDVVDADGQAPSTPSAAYQDAPAPEGGGKPLHRQTHQQISPRRKKDAHKCTCKSDGEMAKKGATHKSAKRVPPQKRSLSTDGGNKQYSSKKTTSVEDAIRKKKKINEEELKEEKNRKEKKRTHDMYTLRKKYKKKNYKKKLAILVHSIVKNIKPREKNYYNKLLEMLNGGAQKQVFWDLFLFPLEGYDQFTTEYNIGWALDGVDGTTAMSTGGHSTFRESASGGGNDNHLGDSLHGDHSFRSTDSFASPCGRHTLKGAGEADPSKMPFFPEDEIFPQVENFIQTYIKKGRKKRSSDGDPKMGEATMGDVTMEDATVEEVKSSASSKKSCSSSIRLLCSFRLYKKKFLNKFTTEHIYLLLLFVCYVNKTMDSFFLRRAGTKGK